MVEEHPYAQALMTLDKRWLDRGIAANVGEEAGSLYMSTWPKQMSVETYDEHYNRTLARAAKIGQSPLDDSDLAVQLRGGWWHVVASPPVDSVLYAAAEEARVVTGGECSTVEHRVQFRIAIMQAISRKVPPTRVQVDAMRGVVVHTKAAILKVSRCQMCPLRPDGTHTDHVGDAKCGCTRRNPATPSR